MNIVLVTHLKALHLGEKTPFLDISLLTKFCPFFNWVIQNYIAMKLGLSKLNESATGDFKLERHG